MSDDAQPSELLVATTSGMAPSHLVCFIAGFVARTASDTSCGLGASGSRSNGESSVAPEVLLRLVGVAVVFRPR
jgi:hypothetical protein